MSLWLEIAATTRWLAESRDFQSRATGLHSEATCATVWSSDTVQAVNSGIELSWLHGAGERLTIPCMFSRLVEEIVCKVSGKSDCAAGMCDGRKVGAGATSNKNIEK